MPPRPTASCPPARPEAARLALLTPPGRGALAVVGVAGPAACQLADTCFEPRGGVPLAARADGAICVGRWHGPPAAGRQGPGEELVVVRQAADRLEIHCHGGHAAAEGVFTSLEAAGGRRQAWPDWLRETGLDPLVVEARLALARAAGPRAARILSRQAAGILQASFDRLAALAGDERATLAAGLGRAARVGLRLTEPWRVVLAGPVNAGKSSLVNALAGHARSIVSAEPGTTRDLVTTRLVLGGWEVDLIDTAGTRAAAESATEQAGIERGRAATGTADLVLRVTPTGEPPPEPAAGELAVITKADLAAPGFAGPAGGIVTSAVTGQGLAELVAAITARLVPEERDEPDLLAGAVPFTLRQVELVRRLGEAQQA
jgi:tRNA modification GTPase